MVEQIKSNFKLWTQAIARTIENSIPGMKIIQCYRNDEEQLLCKYGEGRLHMPVSVLRELYEDGVDIMEVVLAIIELSEDEIGVGEGKEELQDARRFYDMLVDKIKPDESTDWIHEYFIPRNGMYVSLVEDKAGVLYECVWNRQDDQFTINKY